MDWICGIQHAIDYIENHLTDEIDYEKIAKLMLNDLKKVIDEKGIAFSFDESVCKHIAEMSIQGKSGARDIRNNIRKKIEDRVVDIIIESGETPPKSISVTVKKQQLVFS